MSWYLLLAPLLLLPMLAFFYFIGCTLLLARFENRDVWARRMDEEVVCTDSALSRYFLVNFRASFFPEDPSYDYFVIFKLLGRTEYMTSRSQNGTLYWVRYGGDSTEIRSTHGVPWRYRLKACLPENTYEGVKCYVVRCVGDRHFDYLETTEWFEFPDYRLGESGRWIGAIQETPGGALRIDTVFEGSDPDGA